MLADHCKYSWEARIQRTSDTTRISIIQFRNSSTVILRLGTVQVVLMVEIGAYFNSGQSCCAIEVGSFVSMNIQVNDIYPAHLRAFVSLR